MKITRYKELSYIKLQEVEKELNRKLTSTNYIHNPLFKKFKTPEAAINEIWKKSSYWRTPETFSRYHFDVTFEGEYKVPIHVILNEDFEEFISSDEYIQQVEDLKQKSWQKLLSRRRKLKDQLDQISFKFRDHKLKPLADLCIEYIDRRAAKVENYEKWYLSSEDGRNTFKMNELIGDVTFAYRAIERGSIFAYEQIVRDCIDEDFLDNLRESTDKMVERSKKYLAVQMAIEHYKYPGESTITEEEKEFFIELIYGIKREANNYSSKKEKNEAINIYLKNKVPNLKNNPRDDYFYSGRLTKNRIAQTFEIIYGKKFSPKERGLETIKKDDFMDELE